jgi:hypothetical protein
VKKKKKDYYCSSGSCSYKLLVETVSKNGDDSYCRDKKKYCGIGCSEGQYDCEYNSECDSGLECMGLIGGALDGCCNPGNNEVWDETNYKCVQCSKSSDCGTDGYVGDNYCSDGDVYRNYKTFSCSSGTCSSSTAPKLQDDCDNDYEKCSSGACAAKTCGEVDSVFSSIMNGITCSFAQSLTSTCSENSVYTCDDVQPGTLDVLYCWKKYKDCDQYQKCSKGSCVDFTCEEMGYGKGSCTGIDPTSCLDGVDGDAYECKDVGHKKCWVKREDCGQYEKCYDETGSSPAQCWSCGDFSGTTGEQCSDKSDGYKECRNGAVYKCNDQVLWDEILCWEKYDDCETNEKCITDKCEKKTCEEQGYDKGSCWNILNTACFDNNPYDCDDIGNQWCWVKTATCGEGGKCIDPSDPFQGAKCYYCADYKNTAGMCDYDGQTKCDGNTPLFCIDELIFGQLFCWQKQSACSTGETCINGLCLAGPPQTCQSAGYDKGACTVLDTTSCIDGNPYECSDVSGIKCWSKSDTCSSSEICYSPLLGTANCRSCSEFSNTAGQCSGEGDLSCVGKDSYLCKNFLPGLYCWSLNKQCGQYSPCVDGMCGDCTEDYCSAEITGASPEYFHKSVFLPVRVVVRNNGQQEHSYFIQPGGVPDGWYIDDFESVSSTQKIDFRLGPGGTYTATFYVKPSDSSLDSGRSVDITWELYWDAAYSSPNKLIDTYKQSITPVRSQIEPECFDNSECLDYLTCTNGRCEYDLAKTNSLSDMDYYETAVYNYVQNKRSITPFDTEALRSGFLLRKDLPNYIKNNNLFGGLDPKEYDSVKIAANKAIDKIIQSGNLPGKNSDTCKALIIDLRDNNGMRREDMAFIEGKVRERSIETGAPSIIDVIGITPMEAGTQNKLLGTNMNLGKNYQITKDMIGTDKTMRGGIAILYQKNGEKCVWSPSSKVTLSFPSTTKMNGAELYISFKEDIQHTRKNAGALYIMNRMSEMSGSPLDLQTMKKVYYDTGLPFPEKDLSKLSGVKVAVSSIPSIKIEGPREYDALAYKNAIAIITNGWRKIVKDMPPDTTSIIMSLPKNSFYMSRSDAKGTYELYRNPKLTGEFVYFSSDSMPLPPQNPSTSMKIASGAMGGIAALMEIGIVVGNSLLGNMQENEFQKAKSAAEEICEVPLSEAARRFEQLSDAVYNEYQNCNPAVNDCSDARFGNKMERLMNAFIFSGCSFDYDWYASKLMRLYAGMDASKKCTWIYPAIPVPKYYDTNSLNPIGLYLSKRIVKSSSCSNYAFLLPVTRSQLSVRFGSKTKEGDVLAISPEDIYGNTYARGECKNYEPIWIAQNEIEMPLYRDENRDFANDFQKGYFTFLIYPKYNETSMRMSLLAGEWNPLGSSDKFPVSGCESSFLDYDTTIRYHSDLAVEILALSNTASGADLSYRITNYGNEPTGDIKIDLDTGQGTRSFTMPGLGILQSSTGTESMQYNGAGTYTVTITAGDTANPDELVKFDNKASIDVSIDGKGGLNTNPVINSIETSHVYETRPAAVSVSASDFQQNTVPVKVNDTRFVDNGTSFVWQTHLRDRGNYTVTLTATDGSLSDDMTIDINVGQKPMPADINDDGIVDIFDISAIGLSFGSSMGGQKYSIDRDISEDNVIDIVDLAIVGLCYDNGCAPYSFPVPPPPQPTTKKKAGGIVYIC